MSCVQDFVSAFGKDSFCFGMICGSVCAGIVIVILKLFQRYDKDFCMKLGKMEWLGIVLLCGSFGIFSVCKAQGDMIVLSKSFFMITYLVVCSITDYCMQQVYDVMQLFGGILMGGFALGTDVQSHIGGELIVFVLIQGLIFLRMYGEADVMGFLICALSLLEGGLWAWLIHMALTFLFLGIVQGIRRNIASDGNLKMPVALYPYIATAYVFVF